MADKSHDLHDFMAQVSQEVAAEYARIRKRASEDPGTAGDEGESNWAQILREWLPGSFTVVTKGRIIDHTGAVSPQVDVVVLDSTYPARLAEKKLYLAAGVVAAFECKTTLRAAHIRDSMRTCAIIKAMVPHSIMSPAQALHPPIIYGLLAHSHSWTNPGSTPEDNIEAELRKSDEEFVTHPKLSLDALCVADLALWSLGFVLMPMAHTKIPNFPEQVRGRRDIPELSSFYFRHARSDDTQPAHFTPIGALIAHLTRSIAWRKPELRTLAGYYRDANVEGTSRAQGREWSLDVFDGRVRKKLNAMPWMPGTSDWDEFANFL